MRCTTTPPQFFIFYSSLAVKPRLHSALKERSCPAILLSSVGRARRPSPTNCIFSGGWYPPLQIERSGTSASVSPTISHSVATSLGDLSPTSFFISGETATSFCAQRAQLPRPSLFSLHYSLFSANAVRLSAHREPIERSEQKPRLPHSRETALVKTLIYLSIIFERM